MVVNVELILSRIGISERVVTLETILAIAISSIHMVAHRRIESIILITDVIQIVIIRINGLLGTNRESFDRSQLFIQVDVGSHLLTLYITGVIDKINGRHLRKMQILGTIPPLDISVVIHRIIIRRVIRSRPAGKHGRVGPVNTVGADFIIRFILVEAQVGLQTHFQPRLDARIEVETQSFATDTGLGNDTLLVVMVE